MARQEESDPEGSSPHGDGDSSPPQTRFQNWKMLPSSPFSGWRAALANHPTLRLLATPWEYFVTIDQSALWQKHIAWAKPKGSDLKAYVSSQYSSRMVLLSLLLATEMSVFFGSSPELAGLRSRLCLWSHQHDDGSSSVLSFWIGFCLLLNICVTISGILATFATWNVVSAISDANAHCILRSSLGQYVATLSPRLVVASLYLFFLWFLLFVMELLLGSSGMAGDGERFWHELFATQHLPLLLLWLGFLISIMALFFSIVLPLSALGRLVVHTGAMGEHPVLSESLQVELLPRGLHAGLVIRAHHAQRRRTAVTRQYVRPRQPRRRRPPKRPRREVSGAEPPNHGTGNPHQELVGAADNDGTASSVVFGNGFPAGEFPPSGMSVSTASSDGDDGDPESSISPDQFQGTSTRYSSFQQVSRTIQGDGHSRENSRAFPPQPRRSPKHDSRQQRHRRMPTTDTAVSLCLPPATILNLAMTAREFCEVIDNAIDTSSLHSRSPLLIDREALEESETNVSGSDAGEEEGESQNNGLSTKDHSFGITEENQRLVDFRSQEGYREIHERKDLDHNVNSKESSTRRRSSSKSRSGLPLSPYPATAASMRATEYTNIPNPSQHPNHQDLVTRHHRRVSSSRFLLEEWAQENRVRDLYGAAPPADLPHEIAWMLEHENNTGAPSHPPYLSTKNATGASSTASNSSQNPSESPWWLSPFSPPSSARNNAPGRTSGRALHRKASGQRNGSSLARTSRTNGISPNSSRTEQEALQEPLLPDLTGSRDEELGGDLSDLLGEELLLSEEDRRQAI